MIDTRQALMQQLLHHKNEGLTIDELSSQLEISRNAVQQHITILERDGLVTSIGQRSTGGRPSRTYALTGDGYEAFPRNYAVLAQSMLATARDTLGEEVVERILMHMAEDLAKELKAGGGNQVQAVVDIMNVLGYQAHELPDGEGITAVNCIYHKLALQTRAICRYDVKLLSLLLEKGLDHTACMADGDTMCVFELKQPETDD